MTADGAPVERLKAKVQPWGPYLRYNYVTADFSAVDRTGLYYIQYGSQKTETFPIGPNVYDNIWHPTADVWFPVQMDHMFVNEAYRVWHGLPHMDDALQAPAQLPALRRLPDGADDRDAVRARRAHPRPAVGGWFDAGDFDIRDRAPRQHGHATSWTPGRRFKPLRDETLVDQAARFVDIHRPDGKPDLLQQIEHGALQLAAQHRGARPGDPRDRRLAALHQYTISATRRRRPTTCSTIPR